MDQALDRGRLVLRELPVLPDVRDVQERRALQPDVDEGRLHARQHARNASEEDVADQPAQRAALDVQFLHDAGREHGDPRLLRGDVYQYVFHASREVYASALPMHVHSLRYGSRGARTAQD